jgi:hypothetical protein
VGYQHLPNAEERAALAADPAFNAVYAPLPASWSCHAVFCAPNSGTWTSTIAGAGSYMMGGFRFGASTINNESTWTVPLQAGTYTFGLVHRKDTNRGIYTVSLDGSTIATIDGYNATGLETFTETTGVTIATDGSHSLRFLMASKNASSSAYFGAIEGFFFARTGA